MKKIILITLIILLIAVLGVFTGMYYIGDRIVDETLDESLSLLDDIGPEPGSTEGHASNSSDTLKDSGSKAGKSDTAQKKSQLSTEKINQIKKKITAQDKMTAASIVMSKLSTDDIKELKDMLAGGLTEEEKNKAQKLALDRFTNEDIQKFKEMYNKYIINK